MGRTSSVELSCVIQKGYCSSMLKLTLTQRYICPFAACMLLSLTALGCSDSEPAELSGAVTYEGEPVEDGFMRFFPIMGTPGDGASRGYSRWSILVGCRCRPGCWRNYRVSIMGTRETGRKVRAIEAMPGDPPFVMETIQYLPARYNARTGLQIQLKAGVNQEDFVLEGK